jgi:hypothetical protein
MFSNAREMFLPEMAEWYVAVLSSAHVFVASSLKGFEAFSFQFRC